MTDAAVPRLSPPLRRGFAALAVSAVAAAGIAGCGQTRLGTAAIVGSQRITDEQVKALVDESLAAPGVREALPTSEYKGDVGAYRRAVLNVEVERLLAEMAAQRLNVSVDERKVDSRYQFFEQQSGGASQFAAQLAARLAVSPALYRQLVRTEVIESEIGYEHGGVHRPTEAQLRQLYQQYLPTATTATLRVIQLPDEATARRVLAEVEADPASFEKVAARYADPTQQGAGKPQKFVLSRLPQDLAARVQRASPHEIFSYQLTGESGRAFFVIQSEGVERPTLDSARPQLEAQTLQQAAAAGQKYIGQLAREVRVDVSPRYGTWKVDQLAITDFQNPAVRPTATPSSPAPTLPGGGQGSPSPSATPGG